MSQSKFLAKLGLFIIVPMSFLAMAQDPSQPEEPKKQPMIFSYSSSGDAGVQAEFIVSNGGNLQAVNPQTGTHQIIVTGEEIQGESTPNVFYFSTDGDAEGKLITFEFQPKHGFLGIESVELTEELRMHFGAPKSAGIMIGKVTEEGPASAGGFKVGDILTHLNGKAITRSVDLLQALMSTKPGDQVEGALWRDGKVMKTHVILGEFQTEAGDQRPFTTKADVLLKSMHSSKFQIQTAQFPENLNVEWVDAEQGNLQMQIEALQRKIEALEALILKRSGSKEPPE